MQTLRSLAALVAGGVFVSGASAASLPGSKSNLTITATATSEVGAFLVTDTARAKDADKGIEYGRVANPLGHTDETKNYYVEKLTTKTQNFGTKTAPENLVVSVVREESTNLLDQKLTNADVIRQLIARGIVPISNPSGYKLVAVFPADGERGLFFLENEKTRSIYYVGREGYYYGDETGGFDALRIERYGEVETLRYKSTHAFKHQKKGGEVLIDETGVFTETETGSGKVKFGVSLFEGYWDESSESYVSNGTSFYYYGLGSFSSRLQVLKSGREVYYPVSGTLAAGASRGDFEDEAYGSAGGSEYFDEEADEWIWVEGRNNLVTGGVTLSGGKVIDDITPYLDALPPALADFKASIIASYGEESLVK